MRPQIFVANKETMGFILEVKMYTVSVILITVLNTIVNMYKLTVYEDIVFNQSSYRLNRTIWGSVAFRMRSPNFSTFKQAWKGNCNSEPLITMLGKSRRCTSSGSNIPFLVTIICFGCSSTGRERIKAATSSAVFHLAN